MRQRFLCVLIGYLFGTVQTGYFYGKWKGIDVRKKGSGNTGFTNLLRVLGVKAGVVTFLGDCGKTILAICLVRWLFREVGTEFLYVLSVYGGVGAILGHDFPFYLRFRGGKGIAATAGLILCLGIWWIPAGLLVGFLLILFATRYVSVGSLFVATALWLEMIICGLTGQFAGADFFHREIALLFGIVAGLAWWKHRSNLARLKAGTENKIGSKRRG